MKINFFSSFFKTLIIFNIFLCSLAYAKSIERQSIIFYKEESINGINFKHKFEIDNGIKKDNFLINGLSVDSLEYEDAILEAEKEERKVERQKDNQIREDFAELYCKAELKILQLELNNKIKLLQESLEKLSDKKLEPYIVYSKDGLENKEQLLEISNNFLIKVKDFAVKADKNKDLKKVQDFSNKLEQYTQKVNTTFLATVNNAIDRADDTRLLKDLLSLVS